jgi:hypothetical protein
MPLPDVPSVPSALLAGLDLGQAADYSAFVVAERVPIPSAPAAYHLVHLERFPLGTSYEAVVAAVADRCAAAPLRGRPLVLDYTGVGRAVRDVFRRAATGLRVVPVTITAGADVTADGEGGFRVPKRDLAGVLAVLLQGGRLKIAKELPAAAVLTQELLNFRVKLTAAGNDQYEAWREGQHDDLVLAAALALWYGERPTPGSLLLQGAANGWQAPPGLLPRAERSIVTTHIDGAYAGTVLSPGRR